VAQDVEPEVVVRGRFQRLLRNEQLRKLLRYSAVSAVMVPVGQVLLNAAVHALGWHPLVANVVIATVFTPATYLLNKLWVWRNHDRDRVAREAAIFWASAVLGVLCSTFTLWVGVTLVDTTHNAVIGAITFLIAGLVGFGLVWIGRFLFLDHFVFRSMSDTVSAPETAVAAADAA
jgi:putative flippase GtrA